MDTYRTTVGVDFKVCLLVTQTTFVASFPSSLVDPLRSAGRAWLAQIRTVDIDDKVVKLQLWVLWSLLFLLS
jgi:hypothetical protein